MTTRVRKARENKKEPPKKKAAALDNRILKTAVSKWQWSSLPLRNNNSERMGKILTPWPMDMPGNYLKLVNQPLPKPQLENIRHSVIRSKPLGEISWVEKMIVQYDLQYTVRPEGRPKK